MHTQTDLKMMQSRRAIPGGRIGAGTVTDETVPISGNVFQITKGMLAPSVGLLRFKDVGIVQKRNR